MVTKDNLAYLKVSNEAVFVLDVDERNSSATVRRPVQGREGVRHLTEDFSLAELETLDEKFEREYSEMLAVNEKRRSKEGSIAKAEPQELVTLN